jgi:type I restriction enzyme S subunit
MTWKKEKFKTLIEHKSGYTWTKEQETKIPEPKTVRVLTVTNVQKELDLSSELYLKDVSEVDKIKKAVSKDWSIAVSSNGNRSRIGNAVYVKENSEYLFASFLTAFKPKENAEILPDYFFRWLTSHNIQERITAVSEGTTGLGNLDIRFLRNTEINYPENPAEQTAIANLLSKVDEAITAVQYSIKAVEKLKKALMQNLLTGKLKPDGTWRKEDEFYEDEKFGKVPIGWEVSRVKDYGFVQTGKTPPTAESNVFSETENEIRFPFITPGDVGISKYISISERFVTEKGIGYSFKVPVNSICVVCIGSTIGKIGISTIESCTNQQINTLIANENNSGEFFYYMMEYRKPHFKEIAGINATPQINKSGFEKYKLLRPLLKEEQDEIVLKIKSTDENVVIKQTKILTLQRLKKSLMQNLLTGKVRLPEAFIAQFESSVEEINKTEIEQ